MGIHVAAVYIPYEGASERLEAEVAAHVPLLRRIGLATSRPSTALRAPDGTVVEIFEWIDQAAIDAAHEHPDVLAMWTRFQACCTYGTLADLPNATTMFAEFEFIDSY